MRLKSTPHLKPPVHLEPRPRLLFNSLSGAVIPTGAGQLFSRPMIFKQSELDLTFRQ
jgi:hypothetical protein